MSSLVGVPYLGKASDLAIWVFCLSIKWAFELRIDLVDSRGLVLKIFGFLLEIESIL